MHIKKAENSVSLGNARAQECLTYGALTFSPEQCGLLGEIVKYVYDKRSIEAGKEKPVKNNDHAMVAVLRDWGRLKQYLDARRWRPPGVVTGSEKSIQSIHDIHT